MDQALGEIDIVHPDRLSVGSLERSGTPWSALAAVTGALMRAETDLEFLAFEIIEPIADLEWRLFHLSVLGEVLAALRDIGARIRWVAPLSAAGSPGPQYQVTINHVTWDLWFEATGAPQRYQVKSPYRTATVGVNRAPRAIGADIMLCLPGERALALECKWGDNSTYIGRGGYHQASSYLIEMRAGIATHAWSYVIGAEEVVPTRSEESLTWLGGTAIVGVGNIDHVAGTEFVKVFESSGC